MKRRTLLAAAGTGALAALAGCGTAGGLSEDEYDVGMSSTRFLPERHEVAAGDRVVWGNTSSRPHTVTAYEDALPAGADFFASGGFASQGAATEGWRGSGGETGAVEPGETYARTFDVPGTYRYFCVPHEAAGMVGEIVVSE